MKGNNNCFLAMTFISRLLVSNRFTLHSQVYLTVELNQTKQKMKYQKESTSHKYKYSFHNCCCCQVLQGQIF